MRRISTLAWTSLGLALALAAGYVGVALAAPSAAPVQAMRELATGQTTTAALTTEVLVGTAATQIPTLRDRRGLELLNRGGVAIDCCLGDVATCVVGRSRRVESQSSWALDVPSAVTVWCVSTGAAQTTGAATVVSQVPRG